VNNLNTGYITHRPVSISAHHPNQYSGENPPQRHSTIPSVDVYINTNTILCCQPFTNNRTSTRYPRERMIIGTKFHFAKGFIGYKSWLQERKRLSVKFYLCSGVTMVHLHHSNIRPSNWHFFISTKDHVEFNEPCPRLVAVLQ